eukprot:CAMPEP_0204831946 /NCGR_PEP_ID=MMETSP1346-20131115/12223_1 /ASSEMBLY_ACC=CAM_ASM_000771 /TAXON_ID=215587 /ORGANISM="Aplanochytrium stocchinoi, Strain GSBS06" /LENGTH=109 /DNA_ID=CAMNT_0051963417 /DNA_START=128 /DNA_END=454 /DNA_ORIENTATION=+
MGLANTATCLRAGGVMLVGVGSLLLIMPATQLKFLGQKRTFGDNGLLLARICGIYVACTGACSCFAAQSEALEVQRPACIALLCTQALEAIVKALFMPSSEFLRAGGGN